MLFFQHSQVVLHAGHLFFQRIVFGFVADARLLEEFILALLPRSLLSFLALPQVKFRVDIQLGADRRLSQLLF
jgi:hypothetical protein